MGDAGSFGCGFLIAESILRGGGLANPLLALAFTAPISLDVFVGLIRRKRLRMSPFTADRSTCPHHLLARFKGSHVKATLLLWSISLGFVALAPFPLFAGVLLMGYLSLLVILNADPLFYGRPTST